MSIKQSDLHRRKFKDMKYVQNKGDEWLPLQFYMHAAANGDVTVKRKLNSETPWQLCVMPALSPQFPIARLHEIHSSANSPTTYEWGRRNRLCLWRMEVFDESLLRRWWDSPLLQRLPLQAHREHVHVGILRKKRECAPSYIIIFFLRQWLPQILHGWRRYMRHVITKCFHLINRLKVTFTEQNSFKKWCSHLPNSANL